VRWWRSERGWLVSVDNRHVATAPDQVSEGYVSGVRHYYLGLTCNVEARLKCRSAGQIEMSGFDVGFVTVFNGLNLTQR